MLELHGDDKEQRQYRVISERSAFGRSSLDIECPFCSEVVTAYKWSLAGGGKKCPCGAKHTWQYGTIRAKAAATA